MQVAKRRELCRSQALTCKGHNDRQGLALEGRLGLLLEPPGSMSPMPGVMCTTNMLASSRSGAIRSKQRRNHCQRIVEESACP